MPHRHGFAYPAENRQHARARRINSLKRGWGANFIKTTSTASHRSQLHHPIWWLNHSREELFGDSNVGRGVQSFWTPCCFFSESLNISASVSSFKNWLHALEIERQLGIKKLKEEEKLSKEVPGFRTFLSFLSLSLFLSFFRAVECYFVLEDHHWESLKTSTLSRLYCLRWLRLPLL